MIDVSDPWPCRAAPDERTMPTIGLVEGHADLSAGHFGDALEQLCRACLAAGHRPIAVCVNGVSPSVASALESCDVQIVVEPKIARTAVLAAHALQETLVHLPEEADRDREATTDAVEPVLHGDDVVVDLRRVVGGVAGRRLAHLEQQELPDVGLRARCAS
jgi:hypothetical protein